MTLSTKTSRRQLLLAGLLVVNGCTGGETQPATNVVRDSAGVRIVESTAPSWSVGAEWRIEDEPTISFGPEHELYNVRAAFRLTDGRVVVAHGSTLEFLRFSAEGQLLSRNGGRGQGPGEFQGFDRVRRGAADSIVVFDYANFRMSLMDPEGRFVRSSSIPLLPDGNFIVMEDAFADGTLLVTPAGGPPSGQGMERRQRILWRVGMDGAGAARLIDFPELEIFFFDQGGQRRPFFGKTSYYAAGATHVFVGMTERFEVLAYSLTGELEAVFRRRQVPRAFGPSEIRFLINSVVATYENEEVRAGWRRVFQELPTSGQVPAFGWPDYAPSFGRGIQLDDDGNVWVAEYFLPGETRNARTVFGSDGVWLGSLELPARFAPHHIGGDFVLGVWRDELDVESVRLYELVKP